LGTIALYIKKEIIMKKLIFSLMTLLIVGCASKADFEQGFTYHEDSFTKKKTYSLPNLGVLGGSSILKLDISLVYFNIFTIVNADGAIAITSEIKFEGPDWLFISSGESLSLLVDDEMIKLNSPNGSLFNRRVGGGSLIKESAAYYINTDIIKKLAESKTVRVRLHGNEGYIEREFNDGNYQSIRSYYNNFIVKHSIKTP
jgi:hypothetical protein